MGCLKQRFASQLRYEDSPLIDIWYKTVTAYCVAEQFDLPHVVRLLQSKRYKLDPYGTGLYPQVVHIQIPVSAKYISVEPAEEIHTGEEVGDVFIFPSGTLVAWALPEATVSFLTSQALLLQRNILLLNNLIFP